MHANRAQHKLNRRTFLQSAAALALGPVAVGAAEPGADPEPINVAVLGVGSQGSQLMEGCRRIPGVRVQAICDIWEAYNLKRMSRILQKYNQSATAYTDFEQMLAGEKGLHAAVVATPDFWHARHAVACLDRGLHVYCEAPMSNTLEGARSMVEAARRTGRLLQIGHQRRSNPRYILCRERLLNENRLLGQIIAVHGQWNRALQPLLGWPKSCPLNEDTLRKYGYTSMQQFRNWRWYRGLGGGPLLSLGSLQIDVYNWFVGTRPTVVLASACTSTYRKEGFDWPDTVMAICEYDTPQGPIRACYQILSANSSFGHFESFLGGQGTLVISEDSGRGAAYKEPQADAGPWTRCVELGYLRSPGQLPPAERDLSLPLYIVVVETPPPVKQPPYELAAGPDKPRYQPHLENFFDAIRGRAKLNCSAEVGYEAAVTVLKINDAIEAGGKVEFKPADFVV